MAVGYSVYLCPDCGEVLINRNGWTYLCEGCDVIWNKADVS